MRSWDSAPMITAPPPVAKPSGQGAITVAALCCILLTIGVAGRRAAAAWRFSSVTEGTVVTSGCEEESLYAMWRALHGKPVFTDSSRVPYAAAYFNWLFYDGYAAVLRRAADPSAPAGIIAVSRVLTLVGAVAGWVALAVLLQAIVPTQPWATAGVALYVCFGPLVGWWAHTCRPDVWAFAFEITGVTVLLVGRARHPSISILGAAACFYIAWSWKQTFVYALVVAVLFLVIRRHFRHAIALVVITGLIFAATWYGLGTEYRMSQLGAIAHSEFYVASGYREALSAGQKLLPLLLLFSGALVGGISKGTGMNPVAADARVFGLIGAAVTAVFSFVASCKMGAAVNYYFTFALMTAIGGLALYVSRPRPIILMATLATASVLQLLVMTGQIGQIDLSPQAEQQRQRWSLFRQMPEPRYSSDHRLQLPWLNPASPAFILAFNYDLDRRAGRRFEHGGIGGLINDGFFASLLLPAGTKNTFLGGDLTRYRAQGTAAGMTVFVRADATIRGSK